MNIRSTSSRINMTIPLLALALSCGVASAQSSLNTDALSNPKVRVQSCAQVDIAWNLQLIEQYPQIADACQEVVTNNGTKWARFEAKFLRINSDGSVTSEFLDRRGRALGRYTLIPADGQMVTLDGQKQPFSSLRANQQISLYVPEGATALSSEPVVMPDRYARIVRYEPSTATPMAQEPSPVLVADNSPPPRMARLPDTAGPLPWFATAGMLLALGALVLRRFGR